MASRDGQAVRWLAPPRVRELMPQGSTEKSDKTLRIQSQGWEVARRTMCALAVANRPSLASRSPLQRGPIRKRRVQLGHNKAGFGDEVYTTIRQAYDLMVGMLVSNPRALHRSASAAHPPLPSSNSPVLFVACTPD
jgi:hypothetical protein